MELLCRNGRQVKPLTISQKLYHRCKKILWLLLMDGIVLPQGYRATTKRRLLFTAKSTEILGTHLMFDFGRMKD